MSASSGTIFRTFLSLVHPNGSLPPYGYLPLLTICSKPATVRSLITSRSHWLITDKIPTNILPLAEEMSIRSTTATSEQSYSITVFINLYVSITLLVSRSNLKATIVCIFLLYTSSNILFISGLDKFLAEYPSSL